MATTRPRWIFPTYSTAPALAVSLRNSMKPLALTLIQASRSRWRRGIQRRRTGFRGEGEQRPAAVQAQKRYVMIQDQDQDHIHTYVDMIGCGSKKDFIIRCHMYDNHAEAIPHHTIGHRSTNVPGIIILYHVMRWDTEAKKVYYCICNARRWDTLTHIPKIYEVASYDRVG